MMISLLLIACAASESGTTEDAAESADPGGTGPSWMCDTSASSGTLVLASDELDFGETPVGDSTVARLGLSSEGTQDVIVCEIEQTGSGDFAIGGPFIEGPYAVDPNEGVLIEVMFNPGAEGLSEGAITIRSTDEDAPVAEVSLSGDGTVE